MSRGDRAEFAVIGAGPAGVTAAYDLARRGLRPILLEKDVQVGGLSKTVVFHGFRCDIGGHRFFTKNAAVEHLWHEILGSAFLRRPRMSRIYYGGRFYDYPLKPLNTLAGLGVGTSLRVLGSFLWRRVFPHRPETSFEDWVSNRFGSVLYRIFFKTYTEKVWDIPCSELSADWAAQRIRNLNLGRAVLNAMGIGRGAKVASLIEEFQYPQLGPGQMYETMAERAVQAGARLALGEEVVGITHDAGRVTALQMRAVDGQRTAIVVGNVVSSMPLSELVLRLEPPPPGEVLQAARSLRYRSILTVNLIVDAAQILPDTWVYLHAPEIRAGRLQIYKNWSPAMAADPSKSIVGLEYFAWEGDDFWTSADTELMDIALEDLRRLNLVKPSLVEDGFVVRYAKAYPVYDESYQRHVMALREYLERFANLVCIGRYGQFRYNNMDHSIMTALLGVRRLLGESVDPWAVNEDAEYLEETSPPSSPGTL